MARYTMVPPLTWFRYAFSPYETYIPNIVSLGHPEHRTHIFGGVYSLQEYLFSTFGWCNCYLLPEGRQAEMERSPLSERTNPYENSISNPVIMVSLSTFESEEAGYLMPVDISKCSGAANGHDGLSKSVFCLGMRMSYLKPPARKAPAWP